MHIETIPTNDNVRIYHARVEMTDKYDRAERGFSLCDSEFFRQLLSVPGVQSLHGKGYEVWIEKGKAFSWDEVESKIKELITSLEAVAEKTS